MRSAHPCLCAGVLAWLAVAASCEAAAPHVRPRPAPMQGAIVRGTVLTAVKNEKGIVFVWMMPLAKGGRVFSSEGCANSGGLPERWSVGHDGFWVNNAWSLLGPGQMPLNSSYYCTHRFDLGEML